VLGIDQSAQMIKLARKAAPSARFRRASFVDAELPRCDAVVALGEVVNYRFDAGNTPRALERVFRRVCAALRPGGLLIFDAAGPGRIPGGEQRDYRVGEDWAILHGSREDPRRPALTRDITTFRRSGANAYRRTDEVHELRLYAPASARDAAPCGFSRARAKRLRRQAVRPGHRVYVARAP